MIKWLLFTLLAIGVQGFFALFEMACVSFNRIRLQYYVSRGNRRALWINYLIKRPSRLFGTTLIGINTALQMGSECAREFYQSIHLNPDWAPVSQVIIVVIFGELVPMFTARRHPEQIAMHFAPLMIVLARLLTPITWAFDRLSKLVQRKESPYFLSREEVMLAFSETDSEDAFNKVTDSIFQLKNLTAAAIMKPLTDTFLFPSNATVGEVRVQLSGKYAPVLPVYHRTPYNIVSIVLPRDLLRLAENQKKSSIKASPPGL